MIPVAYHISKEMRSISLSFVEQARNSLKRTGYLEWKQRDDDLEIVIPDAICYEGQLKEAEFRTNKLWPRLQVQAYGWPGWDIAFSISGEQSVVDLNADPRVFLIGLLTDWLKVLVTPMSNAGGQLASRIVQDIEELVVGVIAKAGFGEASFDVYAARSGDHRITVSPRRDDRYDSLGRGLVFGKDNMTTALKDELTRLASLAVHVVDEASSRPGEMPLISIGPPPFLHVQALPEIVTIMKLIRKLPPQVALLSDSSR